MMHDLIEAISFITYEEWLLICVVLVVCLIPPTKEPAIRMKERREQRLLEQREKNERDEKK